MNETKTLTPDERAVLEHALDHGEGYIGWFPPGIDGSAQTRLLHALYAQRLVHQRLDGWVVSWRAAQALGRPAQRPPVPTDQEIEDLTDWIPEPVRGAVAALLRRRRAGEEHGADEGQTGDGKQH